MKRSAVPAQKHAPESSATLRRLVEVAREEVAPFHARLLLANMLLAPLPMYAGARIRAAVLRAAGFSIGRGTVIWGTPRISGGRNLYHKLIIGRSCWINVDCFFDLGAEIRLHDHVSIGHEVMILTTTHAVGPSGRRAAAPFTHPVAVGQGAWLGTRSTILPGVTVGAGAIVAAGALVNSDVPPDTMVAGVPARVVKELP